MEESHLNSHTPKRTQRHFQIKKALLEKRLLTTLRASPIDLISLDSSASYTWRKDGVRLRDDDLMLINTEDSLSDVNAIVIGSTHLPYCTTKTTTDLMTQFAESRSLTYTTSRLLATKLIERPVRKIPYITDADIWIPLDGAVKKNATWYNLAQLDNLMSETSTTGVAISLLSFTNDIEVRIPYHYRSVQKKAREALKLYTTLRVNYNRMLSSSSAMLPEIRFSGHYAMHLQQRYGYEYYALTKDAWQHAFFLAIEYEYQRTKNPHLSFQEWEEMWEMLVE